MTTVIYIHGKGGSAAEAEHYRPLFPGCTVIGWEYCAATPWDAKNEWAGLWRQTAGLSDDVILIANSIGAFFAMHALDAAGIGRAYFISPVVDMERLIAGRMAQLGVTEDELRAKREIATPFGEPLSWEYLRYVREHPIRWNAPTHILYGENDPLTPRGAMAAFAAAAGATLTVMAGGEHWFHTREQMDFLDRWIRRYETDTNGG